jgi:hypothetical protein
MDAVIGAQLEAASGESRGKPGSRPGSRALIRRIVSMQVAGHAAEPQS